MNNQDDKVTKNNYFPIPQKQEKKHSVKVKFTPEEDEKLKMLVLAHGTNSWSFIAKLMETRNHRQCRERWKNYLNPSLRSDPWTFEEDKLLVDKYAEYGPKWNKISKFFVNRSDNSIRNRWQLMLRQWERQNKSSTNSHESETDIKNYHEESEDFHKNPLVQPKIYHSHV